MRFFSNAQLAPRVITLQRRVCMSIHSLSLIRVYFTGGMRRKNVLKTCSFSPPCVYNSHLHTALQYARVYNLNYLCPCVYFTGGMRRKNGLKTCSYLYRLPSRYLCVCYITTTTTTSLTTTAELLLVLSSCTTTSAAAISTFFYKFHLPSQVVCGARTG